MRQGRESEAAEVIFCVYANKPLHTGVRTGCQYLINLSVCVRVTFVVFTDYECCMMPPLASFKPLLVMRQGRGSETTEAIYCL